MRRLAQALLATAISIAVTALLGSVLGIPPTGLLSGLVRGSLGTPYALAETILRSVPLLMTSLSVLLAFRTGIWNIGAEGQFIVGGIAAFLACSAVPPLFAVPAGLLAAFLAGGIWGFIPAWLKLSRNTPEVLTTILLNFVALHLLGFAVHGPLKESAGRYPQSELIPAAAWLPSIGGERLHIGFLIALGAAIGTFVLLEHSAEGLRLRATGFNPAAASFAGIDVRAEIRRVMLLSGGLAGVGGGIELLGVTHRLFERFAAGHGYSAIAVALVAQLHPLGAIASAFFFGAFATGAGELQREGITSSALAVFLQGIVILALLLFTSPRLATRLAGLRFRKINPGEEGA